MPAVKAASSAAATPNPAVPAARAGTASSSTITTSAAANASAAGRTRPGGSTSIRRSDRTKAPNRPGPPSFPAAAMRKMTPIMNRHPMTRWTTAPPSGMGGRKTGGRISGHVSRETMILTGP